MTAPTTTTPTQTLPAPCRGSVRDGLSWVAGSCPMRTRQRCQFCGQAWCWAHLPAHEEKCEGRP